MKISDSKKASSWQIALATAITDPEELLTLLHLDIGWLTAAVAAAKLFPLKVPHSFLSRIQKGNPDDPLLQQILPLGAELDNVPGYVNDPLEEAKVNPIPGLLHKYQSRVLLTLTGACGINCRFCFRRAFPYVQNNPGSAGWQKALDYIAKDHSLVEVILSGGDPLIVNDHLLEEFVAKLAAIPHIKRLRIHSRMPIVLPERITPEFLKLSTLSRLKIVLVVHCNHAQEIDATVIEKMQQLRDAGIVVLNQSVLLRGINDDVDTLVALSEALFAANIQPYYLHLLDKTAGTAHFDLPAERALEIHWGMTQRLSGYLVPKLVYEKPGAPAKIALNTTSA